MIKFSTEEDSDITKMKIIVSDTGEEVGYIEVSEEYDQDSSSFSTTLSNVSMDTMTYPGVKEELLSASAENKVSWNDLKSILTSILKPEGLALTSPYEKPKDIDSFDIN